MRYDDLSQDTSGTAPTTIARADVDALPAGSMGPESGNTITGTGTITGAAGADSIAEPPAQIVAVEGAAGPADGANGSFQVTGHYGVLTIGTDGSYTYVRNAGTPDGVEDIFSYTLADRSGQQSSSTLTINVGRDASSEAAATAAVLPGVVTLPPGVELSDIRVVGRDLVIDLPDGTQMVIPGGAVFVPQLVIGDVEVPASNVAALLIDSEPQPAAGPPQSSGGNFAFEVPDLDPGIPLGDLLPPTELSFTPPEFEEVGQFIDREPTIAIVTPGNPAGAVDATDSVDESGLPARGSEPEGTLEPQDIETTTGTIVFTAEDGLDSITINGVEVATVGQQIEGERGTLTITSIDLASGEIGYTYTVTDNTTEGLDDFDDFTVVVTDSDGDTATATLHIDIADDEPIANDDSAIQDPADAPITVDVLANDVEGADGVADASVSYVAGSLSGSGSVAYNNDGTFTYTPAAGEEGTVTFDYQITDGDGDTSSATVTITLAADSVPTIGTAQDLSVDEDGLASANADSGRTGEVANGGNATDSGTITVDFGNDVPADPAAAIGFINPSALNGQLTQDGQPITFSIDGSGNLIGQVNGTGAAVITIAFTSATAGSGGNINYGYQVTLGGPVDHSAVGTEDSIDLSGVQFQVTDSDGDSLAAPGSFDVTIHDDIPTDFTPDAAVVENTGSGTFTGSLDSDGTLANNVGADGFGSLAWNVADGAPLLDSNGNPVTVMGDPVFLYVQPDDSLLATTDVSDANATVFTATLDPTGSTYDISIEFEQPLDNGSTSAGDFSAAAAGNTPWKGVDPDVDINGDAIDIEAPDPNPDSVDLLLTPVGATTINTDADDIGTGTGQKVNPDQALRIDLVQDLRRDPGQDEGDAGGYLYDTHVGQKVFTFEMVEVQGSSSATSVVRIEAFNVDDADLLSQSDVGNTAINTAVDIDPASIVVHDSSGTLLVEGVDYEVIEDGTAVFVSGLHQGDAVTFEATGGATFEAVTIANASNDANPEGGTFSGAAFGLGGFLYGQNDPGSAVAFELPVLMTDVDGDTSEGTIDVTVNPVGTTTTSTTTLATTSSVSTMSLESSSLLATNDNIEAQKSLNSTSNTVLFGAVAAAGLSYEAAAAESASDGASDVESTLAETNVSGPAQTIELTQSDDSNVQLITGETKESLSQVSDETTAGSSSDDVQSLSVDEAVNGPGDGPSELPQGTEAPQSGQTSTPTITADSVIMPSAEMLAATNGEAVQGAQQNQVVGKVLADALAGGGNESVIDAALSQLPGDSDAVAGLEQLASQDSGTVPAWHSAGMATFAGANSVFSAEAMMLHQDAAPTAQS